MSLFFSIITPTYNREDIITDTLDSIASQTEESYEVIVIDDGSEDQTRKVVDEHPLDINYVYQRNAGPGAARNRGIQQATGQYLTFLDSDDCWFPWTLAVARSVIEQYHHPALLSIPMTDWEQRDLENMPGTIECEEYPDFLRAAREGHFLSMANAVIRRRSFLTTTGFLPEQVNAEDHDLALQLGTAPGFVRLTSPPMCAVRDHEVRLTSDASKTLKGMHRLLDKEKNKAYPGGSERKWDRRYLLSQHIRSASVEGIKNGEFVESFRLYTRTLSWNIVMMRMKYLVGLPALALYQIMDRMRS